jgi:hypothetical protein
LVPWLPVPETYPDQFSLCACWTSVAADADAAAPRAHTAVAATNPIARFMSLTVRRGAKSDLRVGEEIHQWLTGE